MAEQNRDDQLEYTYSSYVRIRDEALKTCRRRWTIVKSGERGSGISVLAARHDDDYDDSFETNLVFQNVAVQNKYKNVYFILYTNYFKAYMGLRFGGYFIRCLWVVGSRLCWCWLTAGFYGDHFAVFDIWLLCFSGPLIVGRRCK